MSNAFLLRLAFTHHKVHDSCFSASQAMGKRKKPRLTSRKHAGTNGGGKRPTQEPADDASVAGSEASSSASSCSDASVQSRLSKAAKPDALASPRSSTPLPVDPSVRLEKDLRNKKKLLREIERLAAKRRGSLNREELVKLERLGTVRSQVGALEAELGEIHLAALDEEEPVSTEAELTAFYENEDFFGAFFAVFLG